MLNTTNYYKQQLSSILKQFTDSLGYQKYKVIVSANEVNHHHGVGIFLQRIFPNTDDIFSIRSLDLYDGEQTFGHQQLCLQNRNPSFHEVLEKIRSRFVDISPQAALVIPYFPSDFLIGLALKKLYDCPLCVFIMDDQNIFVNHVEDHLVSDLLAHADLCLGISRPLCDAYEQKFNKKFWFVPPVVEDHLIQKQLPDNENSEISKQGILIGNIWSQKWLDQLRELTKQTGVKINWYGNPNRNWIHFEEQELENDGISFRGFLPEEQLIQELRQANFAIIPTGSSQALEDRPEFSQLSLPSRSCFMVATANLPILVVGEQSSAIAQFVRENDLGVVCQYESQDFLEKVNYLSQADNQRRIRNSAFQIAQKLRANALDQWIWDSLALGRATDLRFEKLVSQAPSGEISVVITPNEVTQKHGTGALVRRVFPDDSMIISVRSDNHYDGDHHFGLQSYHFPHRGWTRPAVFANIMQTLGTAQITQIQRIFCVPYFPEDLMTAIALKEIYGVPLAIWIMDDQNVAVNNIPDDLMKEFLSKADVRFATHPELRDAYENKYGLKFWLLPAVVPDALITSEIATPSPDHCEQKRGALLGSIWSQKWFNALCESIQGAGVQLDWFGNSQYYWLTDTEAELQAKGIYPQGLTPEEQLAEKLKEYPFIVVPYGTLDERDDQPQLSQLSLPGRILFALATANTPVILLGSSKSSAANFIKRFNMGVICDYTAEDLTAAVDYVLDPENQQMLRENAVKVAQNFSDRGIDQWIWQSLEAQQAADARFESIMPRSPIDIVHFIEPPVPSLIYKDYVQVYQVMRRLKVNHYHPDFVMDVGASHGIWSHTASQLFPDARFILIDPLISRYEQAARNYYLNNVPNAKFLEIAVSNQSGQLSFQVSPDLYGSSLLTPADFRTYETVTVAVKTLDQVASEESLSGRGILKLDVQCAEHIVLEGATHFLEQVDLVIAELSFVRYDEKALVFLEMLNLLEQLGFRYYDETGEWRSPIDGTLLQKEVVFIRRNLLVPELSRKI